MGEQHASFLFPLWLEKDWGQWSAFGGGGCEINRGGNSENFCLMGAVVTRQFTTKLQLGLEISIERRTHRALSLQRRWALGFATI